MKNYSAVVCSIDETLYIVRAVHELLFPSEHARAVFKFTGKQPVVRKPFKVNACG